MNGVDARSREILGGYHGEFRKVHKAAWEVVCLGGTPCVFETAQEAEVAAWRALRSHLCNDIVGSGAKASSGKSKAEELFGSIFKRGKRIQVERKKGA
ncbi:hypothetical protein GA830_10365 [Mesorhizobium sp. NBSH29]|uniref:hypothetical protein n=1 Tax=Mesorhizobium sp. NBSH29 TaxID=2654249 RepID=UPI001896656B|nr:hypothetical protein [Mesorhizobium sp. NBSH29]QPC87098.1 hypothetical protein GA830_10365 [Mesorhizobium sp. NBSH29]